MEKGKAVKDKQGSKGSSRPRPPSFSGYTLFTEEFFLHKEDKEEEKEKEKGKQKGKKNHLQNFKDTNLEVRDAWNNLSEEERGQYTKRAEQLRGPGKGKTYVLPFLTRCAPKQFMAVCQNLKDRPDAMERLKRIGFDKLVNICCPQINRDLCAMFM